MSAALRDDATDEPPRGERDEVDDVFALRPRDPPAGVRPSERSVASDPAVPSSGERNTIVSPCWRIPSTSLPVDGVVTCSSLFTVFR